MATSYPRSPRSAFFGWAGAHAQEWAQDPAQIGLTPQRVAEYALLVEQARAAQVAQVSAQSAAAAATATLNSATAALERATGDILRTVRAFAASSENENRVLIDAFVAPVRPDRGPAEMKPAQPSQPTVALIGIGELEVRWTCRQPRGTSGASYTVYRRLPGERTASFIGTAGGYGRDGKRFIDRTVPSGSAWVEYTVVSHRGNASSESSPIAFVQFGAAPPVLSSSNPDLTAAPAPKARAA